jgi:putative transcriptional regulator
LDGEAGQKPLASPPDFVDSTGMAHSTDRPTRSGKRPTVRSPEQPLVRPSVTVGVSRGRRRLAQLRASVAGQLLIAMPGLADPRFAQTVLYICAHNHDGAMGLVLNRPLTEPRFADLIEQLDIEAATPQDIRICAGGPVEQTRGFVLHSPDWQCEDTLRIDAGSALSTSIDVLRALAIGAGPARSILALGYAGWGGGQLDAELQRDSWLVAPATSAILFDARFDTKWRRALGQIGIDPAALSTESGHA